MARRRRAGPCPGRGTRDGLSAQRAVPHKMLCPPATAEATCLSSCLHAVRPMDLLCSGIEPRQAATDRSKSFFSYLAFPFPSINAQHMADHQPPLVRHRPAGGVPLHGVKAGLVPSMRGSTTGITGMRLSGLAAPMLLGRWRRVAQLGDCGGMSRWQYRPVRDSRIQGSRLREHFIRRDSPLGRSLEDRLYHGRPAIPGRR